MKFNKYLPPLVLTLIAWVVPLGVAAGIWSVDPRAGWFVLPVSALAVTWVVWIWIYQGLEWAVGKDWPISVPFGHAIQIIVPFVAASIFVQILILPPLNPPNCAPNFSWEKRTKSDFNKDLKLPVLYKFARLVPTTAQDYAMTTKADGGGLKIFQVAHSNSDKDPKPWQLKPTGIGYKAIAPGFTAVFVITAAKPSLVRLDITYECISGVTR